MPHSSHQIQEDLATSFVAIKPGLARAGMEPGLRKAMNCIFGYKLNEDVDKEYGLIML